MNVQEIIAEGTRVIDVEAAALSKVAASLDETFAAILEAILNCKGKLVITGMGKPGHIASKLAATFSSLGVPSFKLHPAEAMHGDLGMIDARDVVLAISYSGESDEIVSILPNIKMIGATLIALTGNAGSTLARSSDIVQVLPELEEACHLGLAPTSSTTAALAWGDALAVTASEVNGFGSIDFGKRHPAGSLGKKLVLRVRDLMASGDEVPSVPSGSILMDAIDVISSKCLGVACVTDGDRLLGIITDGDVRRLIAARVDIYAALVDDAMTKEPYCAAPDDMAYNVLGAIREHHINCMPVVDGDVLVGTVTWQHIVRAGIVL